MILKKATKKNVKIWSDFPQPYTFEQENDPVREKNRSLLSIYGRASRRMILVVYCLFALRMECTFVCCWYYGIFVLSFIARSFVRIFWRYDSNVASEVLVRVNLYWFKLISYFCQRLSEIWCNLLNQSNHQIIACPSNYFYGGDRGPVFLCMFVIVPVLQSACLLLSNSTVQTHSLRIASHCATTECGHVWQKHWYACHAARKEFMVRPCHAHVLMCVSRWCVSRLWGPVCSSSACSLLFQLPQYRTNGNGGAMSHIRESDYTNDVYQQQSNSLYTTVFCACSSLPHKSNE